VIIVFASGPLRGSWASPEGPGPEEELVRRGGEVFGELDRIQRYALRERYRGERLIVAGGRLPGMI